MIPDEVQEILILGVTEQGKPFRPSDWAERLAGVMSQFGPGANLPGCHLRYSPWCLPTLVGGVKCVVLQRNLKGHSVMAWDFVLNFAKDNQLQLRAGGLQQKSRSLERLLGFSDSAPVTNGEFLIS